MTNQRVKSEQLRVAVFGLGYVGTVTAACLADLGHTVIGVDVVTSKVDALNAGSAPVIEPGLGELVRSGVARGRLSATSNAADAVSVSDIAVICVGTPSRASGDYDLSYIRRVTTEIGTAVRGRNGPYSVVLRSTVLPGTTDAVLPPLIAESLGGEGGANVGFAHNPEFLREGTAIADFRDPPFTVVGTHDARVRSQLRAMYARVNAPFIETEPGVSETLKLSSNAFHALKVVFANEIGILCKEIGVDSRAVMDAFVQDRKLNVSARYLRPGFAFGGSCLPKDVRALSWLGRERHRDVPVLDAILRSNELHVRHALRMVEESHPRTVGMLGLVFKPDTDDLRESPVVELAQTLLGRGRELRIYDPYLNVARLSGSNKQFIDKQIPHLTKLLVGSAQEVVATSDVVVVAYDSPDFRPALAGLNGSRRVIDLAGVPAPEEAPGYAGIAW